MDSVVYNAYAKINLALDVAGGRPDGYHEIKSVIQSIGLSDRLTFSKTDRNEITLDCCGAPIPAGRGNLVYRAVELIKDKFGIKSGVSIRLKKGIPISAGLGGGSADSAAAISAVDALFDLGLTESDKTDIGFKLGADVPFFIRGGTMLAEGAGERLTPLARHPDTMIVIATPPVLVSTAEVYRLFDKIGSTGWPDVDSMISAIVKHDLAGITSNFGNALTDAAGTLCGDIGRLIDFFLDSGAENASMTGSGPTVFAYFSSEDDASKCAVSLSEAFPHIQDIFVTGIMSESMEMLSDAMPN